jgi:DNA-binding CsgD family transcriptional regulator
MAMAVLGRQQELATIARVLDEWQAGSLALIIEGDAGIGKTTVWEAALELARARSWRVLAARPAEAEVRFSYGAARDLLGPLIDETIAGLPGPQHRAVETAFLRAEGHADAHAVSAGVLGILRAASAAGPVLVGIDDLQWLDAASARVLEFALRRMTAEPVAVLAASRPPGPGPVPLRLERAFGGQPLHTVVLGPMPVGDVHRLVHDRLGTWLPRPVLRRLHGASGGNPFFTLEMARSLIRSGMPASSDALPVPGTLGGLVRDRLAPRSPAAREALQVVAAAPRAPVALVTAAGQRGQMMAGLAEAEDAGIVARSGDRLEFTHPLLASVVYAQIPPAKRRRLHRAIAAALAGSSPGVPADPGARAWHLALGAEGPDAAVAEPLEAAAAEARSAGAPEGAAELAELARRLTPPGQDRDRMRRTVALAQYLFEAGDTSGARSELEALVAVMAPGPDRARVLLRLAMVLYWAESLPAGAASARQAAAEAGPGTAALAEAHVVVAQLCDASNLEREAHARQALELPGQQPDPDPRILSSALLALAMARYYTGQGLSREVLAKAIELEADLAERPRVSWRAETVLGEFPKYTDDFAAARVILEAARREAVEEGDESSLPDILGHLGELELWCGDWERAARYADECVEAAERTGQEQWIGINLYVRGLVNAHLGRADVARRDAEAALSSGERRGDPWVTGISLWVLGFLELSLGRLAETGRHLSRAWEIGESIGLREPGQWRFHADHLEALVGLGELGRAGELLAGFEERALATSRPWALATAARCRALLLAAQGDPDGALAAAEEALAHHERLPMPFELGRTLLAQGQLRRRARQKRAARESLQEALQIFERLGAPLWADRARAELRRIGLRPPAPLELTPTEERVAELVAAGHTNREVAQVLFLSVHTVEDNLRRICRKLGVRSRTELAARRPDRVSQRPIADRGQFVSGVAAPPSQ